MLISDKDKEFLTLLEKEPVRLENRRKWDKFSELNDEEMKGVLGLQDKITLEEACKLLKPIYMYKM